MNWIQLLLKLSTFKNQVLLWDIHPWILLTLFNGSYLNKLLENISK